MKYFSLRRQSSIIMQIETILQFNLKMNFTDIYWPSRLERLFSSNHQNIPNFSLSNFITSISQSNCLLDAFKRLFSFWVSNN